MININKVSKTYDGGKTYAVDHVSLNIKKGETIVIVGSSGSGKTTLLKMINRLIEPSSGKISINNKNIENINPIQLRRNIGYVFQGIGLFPHMTVAENIAIVLRLNKVPIIERKKRVAELLNLVNLDPKIFAQRLPIELSGGQQQRVGVARALASAPEILLMDEPFGALDAIARDVLQNELIELKKRLNKTIVFVTHDIFEAMRLADRLAIMNHGKLEQIGEKEIILRQPATAFVQELFQNVR